MEDGMLGVSGIISTSLWEVLKDLVIAHKSSFKDMWRWYMGVFLAKVAGVDSCCDFLSALEASYLLGIPYVPIDIWLDITHDRQEQLETLIVERPQTARVKAALLVEWAERQMDFWKGGREGTGTGGQALFRVFLAFLRGKPAPMADLAAFRSFFHEKLSVDSTEKHTRLAPRVPPEKEEFNSRTALIHERDDFMAYSLARLSEEHKTIVAVVGAGHVAGIRGRFALYSLIRHVSKEGQALDYGWKVPVPTYASDWQEVRHLQAAETKDALEPALSRQRALFLGIVAFWAFVCYKRPTLSGALFVRTLLVGGLLVGFLVGVSVTWAAFGAYLNEATRRAKKVTVSRRFVASRKKTFKAVTVTER